MLNMDFIKEILTSVYQKYHNIRLGIIGSYANGTATAESDLDILIDGDSIHGEIADYIKDLFVIPVDVLWLELLEKEDKRLDMLLMEVLSSVNEYSAYKTIIKEVVWI